MAFLLQSCRRIDTILASEVESSVTESTVGHLDGVLSVLERVVTPVPLVMVKAPRYFQLH